VSELVTRHKVTDGLAAHSGDSVTLCFVLHHVYRLQEATDTIKLRGLDISLCETLKVYTFGRLTPGGVRTHVRTLLGNHR
jgi:hypothetical protein